MNAAGVTEGDGVTEELLAGTEELLELMDETLIEELGSNDELDVVSVEELDEVEDGVAEDEVNVVKVVETAVGVETDGGAPATCLQNRVMLWVIRI